MTITIVPDVDEDGHADAHDHCYHPTGLITEFDRGLHYEHLVCCHCGYNSGRMHGAHWRPNPIIYPDIRTTAQRLAMQEHP